MKPLALVLRKSVIDILDWLLTLISLSLFLLHDDLREAGLDFSGLDVVVQDVVRVLDSGGVICVAVLSHRLFLGFLSPLRIDEDGNDLITRWVIVRAPVLLALAELPRSYQPGPLRVSFIGRKPFGHVLSQLSVRTEFSFDNQNDGFPIFDFELKLPLKVIFAPVNRLSRHAHLVADLLLNQPDFDKSFALELKEQIFLLEKFHYVFANSDHHAYREFPAMRHPVGQLVAFVDRLLVEALDEFQAFLPAKDHFDQGLSVGLIFAHDAIVCKPVFQSEDVLRNQVDDLSLLVPQ